MNIFQYCKIKKMPEMINRKPYDLFKKKKKMLKINLNCILLIYIIFSFLSTYNNFSSYFLFYAFYYFRAMSLMFKHSYYTFEIFNRMVGQFKQR